MDFAQRVHDHQYRMDPIIRSLLDTDFYKLLMLQVIWKLYKDIPVTFAMKNRTSTVFLSDEVSELELVRQLGHVKTLQFTPSELIWLQGNTFYGKKSLFEPEFIEFLRTLRLSNIDVWKEGVNYRVEFPGTWTEVTLWEIYCLPIVNELRNRHLMSKMSKLELDVMYSAGKTKLWEKLKFLNRLNDLNLTDFGTRRRHSFLWQEWAVTAAAEALGSKFTGTSNAYLAMKLGLEAKGTNAHEMPMVAACLANSPEEIFQSQYKILEDWASVYDGALRIALPDTFGTRQFLQHVPEWFNDWAGVRIDSMDPHEAAAIMPKFWESRGQDPKEKLTLFSDGLDATDIYSLQTSYGKTQRIGFGWGTLLTNDFRDCHPYISEHMKPISLVCKVKEAAGKSAVKLSDNLAKATGDAQAVAYYKDIFGSTQYNKVATV